MKSIDGVRVKAETSTSSCYGGFTFTEQHRPVLGPIRDPMWESSMCRGDYGVSPRLGLAFTHDTCSLKKLPKEESHSFFSGLLSKGDTAPPLYQ